MSVRVLSTKKLNHQQSEKFRNYGIELIDADFIQIQPVDFQYKYDADLLIFTSKNAVKSIAESEFYTLLKKTPAVCVGHQTKKILEDFGFTVLETENYAEELAQKIIAKYSTKKTVHFCGNIRRAVLSEMLLKNKIHFAEYEVYKTFITPHKMDEKLEGILFFSPSGIESFFKENSISNEICFCIGTTTAGALTVDTKQIQISREQNIDAVIDDCLKYFAPTI